MKKLITAVLSVLIISTSAFAGVGEATFYFLEINPSAKAGALGEASVASRNNVDGLFHNPASIASLEGDINGFTAVNPYMGTFMQLFVLGGTFKMPFEWMTVGGGLVGLNFSDELDLGTSYDSGNFAFSGSAGIDFNKMLSLELPIQIDIGGTLTYAYENLDVKKMHAMAFDAGAIATLQDIIPMSVLSFGLHGKNLGGSLTGEGKLPVGMVVGFAYRFNLLDMEEGSGKGDKLNFTLLTDVNLNVDGAKVQLGLDTGLFNIGNVRLGYIIGEDAGGAAGLSLGAGLAYPIIPALPELDFKLDYSFTSVGDLGMQNNIQLGVTYRLKSRNSEEEATEEEIETEEIDDVVEEEEDEEEEDEISEETEEIAEEVE